MLSLDDGAGIAPLATSFKDNSLGLGVPSQLANMGLSAGFGVTQEQAQVQAQAQDQAQPLEDEAAPIQWDAQPGKRAVAWERKVPQLPGTFGEKVVQHVLNYFRMFCRDQRGELQIDEKVGMFRGRKRGYYHCRCFIEEPGAAPPMAQETPETTHAPTTLPVVTAMPSGAAASLVPGPAVDEEGAYPVTTAQSPHPTVTAQALAPSVTAQPLPPVVQAQPVAPVVQACPAGQKLLYPGTPQQRCVPISTVVAEAVQASLPTTAARDKDRPTVIGEAVSRAVTAVKLAAGAPTTSAKVAGAKAGQAVREAVEGRPVTAGQEVGIVTAAVQAALQDAVKSPVARVVGGKMVLGCPVGYKKVALTTGAVKCVRSAKGIKKVVARQAPVRPAFRPVAAHPTVRATAR